MLVLEYIGALGRLSGRYSDEDGFALAKLARPAWNRIGDLIGGDTKS